MTGQNPDHIFLYNLRISMATTQESLGEHGWWSNLIEIFCPYKLLQFRNRGTNPPWVMSKDNLEDATRCWLIHVPSYEGSIEMTLPPKNAGKRDFFW